MRNSGYLKERRRMLSVLITLVLTNTCGAVASTLLSRNEAFDFMAVNEGSRVGLGKDLISTDILIKSAGFEPVVHNVITEDGYILRLTRIKTLKEGPPVLLVHGLFEASDSWLQRGRKEDLAFILADSGFDVWIADLRGNIFSRKHQTMKANKPEFWDFSFHEIAIYDLPAIIKEILQHSLCPKIFYIGHSMGTTAFFILTSTRPEFNNYIQASIMLSPIAFAVKEMKSNILKQMFRQSGNIKEFLKTAKVYDLLPRNDLLGFMMKAMCSKPMQDVCLNIIGDLSGENRGNLNKEKLGDYLRVTMSGSSVKTLEHFSQIYRTDEFKQFDYGKRKNLEVYGRISPPRYNLDKVSTPVVLFYSKNDHLLDEQGVKKLANLLPNVIHKEALPKYSHMDYLFGNDAPKILYSKILKILRKTMQFRYIC